MQRKLCFAFKFAIPEKSAKINCVLFLHLQLK